MLAARLTPGAISVSNSSHLLPISATSPMNPVSARAGQARNEPGADRVADDHKYDRDRPRLPLECSGHRSRACEDHVGLQVDQFFREHPHPIDVATGPTNVHPHVAAICPTQLLKLPREPGKPDLCVKIVFVEPHEHA